MASVFLSYDHEDAARAAPIAAALEKAGHSVWWDRQIHGGAEYNSAIEGAVEQADVVVVLWSERSVKSAWVRDEAAEGRDSGKLVPVTLDGAKPPMGFRQFQTISLAHSGRKRARELAALVQAVEAISDSSTDRTAPSPMAPIRSPKRRLPILPISAAALVIALIIGALFVWTPLGHRPSSPVVAVAAADSSSGSQDYARNLLAQLGELESARPDELQLVGAGGRKRANLIFEVAGGTDGQRARANLVLLNGSNGTLLWSKAFERQRQDSGDLRQQLGYTAARVLECAVEAHPGGRQLLEPEPLKLYLNGCAAAAAGDEDTLADLLPAFRQVIAAAPRFEGAWAKLLLAEDDAYSAGYQRLEPDLRRDIAAARKINPQLPEAYLVEADLLPFNAFGQRLSLADRAVASDPKGSAPLAYRSASLFAVGRISDALDDAKRAAERDPISPRVRQHYIFALAQTGRTQAALDEIANAERIWPGSSVIAAARFTVNLRYADPEVASQMVESGQVAAGWSAARSFLQARRTRKPEDIELAVNEARAAFARSNDAWGHLVQTLSIFDREDELLKTLMRVPLDEASWITDATFRPAAREFWRDPRSLQYAKRVGLLQYWQSSGEWPDFCFATDLPYDCKKEAAKLGA